MQKPYPLDPEQRREAISLADCAYGACLSLKTFLGHLDAAGAPREEGEACVVRQRVDQTRSLLNKLEEYASCCAAPSPARPSPQDLRKRCRGEKKNGQPCPLRCHSDTGFCRHHQDQAVATLEMGGLIAELAAHLATGRGDGNGEVR